MPSIHASAVLVGARAVLIRGPSGAGKSQLALGLLRAAESGHPPFARLVADDRSLVEARHGRLVVRPVPELAGVLIEVRGRGIRKVPYEAAAVVGLVVDLAAPDGDRMPASAAGRMVLESVELARLAVAPGEDALRLVLAAHTGSDAT